MPPLVPFAIASVVAGLGIRWARREWRRVNDLLDQEQRATEVSGRADLPTLRRDPATGDWRPS
jgi:hypothetical protein